jgi:hypothetical protein
VTKFLVECNYLQAMEGDYDPGHGPFLHTQMDGSPQRPQLNVQVQQRARPVPADEPFPRAVGPRRQTEADKASWGTVEDTASGVFFVSGSERRDGTKVASVSPWMMPIYCTAGTTAGTQTRSTNLRVPIDNTHIWFFRLRWSYDPIPDAEVEEYKHGGWYYPQLVPGTYRGVQNIHNDYMIDRNVQKNFTYSGIPCFPWQDIAMMENQWGPIADRTQEHLTSSDFRIIYVRRRLLKAVKALAAGIEPQEPWNPEAYAYHTASVVTKEGTLEEAMERAKALASEQRIKAEAPEIAVRA